MGRSRSRSRSRSRGRDSRDKDGVAYDDPRAPPVAEEDQNQGNNLYIGNISFHTEDMDLENAFKEFGQIKEAQVVKDPYSKTSRGFGFVIFERRDDAEAAAKAMHGATLNGRTLKVEVSRRARGHKRTPGQYLGPASASSKYGAGGSQTSRSPGRGDRGDRGGGRDRGDDRGSGRDRDRYRDDRDSYRGRDDRGRDDRGRDDRGRDDRRRDDRGGRGDSRDGGRNDRNRGRY